MKRIFFVGILALIAVCLYKFGITYKYFSAEESIHIRTKDNQNASFREIFGKYGKYSGFYVSGFEFHDEQTVLFIRVSKKKGDDSVMTFHSREPGIYDVAFYEVELLSGNKRNVKDDFMAYLKANACFSYEMTRMVGVGGDKVDWLAQVYEVCNLFNTNSIFEFGLCQR